MSDLKELRLRLTELAHSELDRSDAPSYIWAPDIVAEFEAAVRADERDKLTDQLDYFGDEVEDFYPLGDWHSRQHVKKALHRASKRLFFGSTS